MKFRPILFTTDMVRSMIRKKKDVTRRLINPQPDFITKLDCDEWAFHLPGEFQFKKGKCRFGCPEDGLWIREAWKWEDGIMGIGYYLHRADEGDAPGPWKPGVHMPKEAACRFLKIVKITAERAHDITEEDAIREGVLSTAEDYMIGKVNTDGPLRYKNYTAKASGYGHPDYDFPTVPTARESYISLWCKINGMDSWASNPMVWRIEYEEHFRPVNWPDA